MNVYTITENSALGSLIKNTESLIKTTKKEHTKNKLQKSYNPAFFRAKIKNIENASPN